MQEAYEHRWAGPPLNLFKLNEPLPGIYQHNSSATNPWNFNYCNSPLNYLNSQNLKYKLIKSKQIKHANNHL